MKERLTHYIEVYGEIMDWIRNVYQGFNSTPAEAIQLVFELFDEYKEQSSTYNSFIPFTALELQ